MPKANYPSPAPRKDSQNVCRHCQLHFVRGWGEVRWWGLRVGVRCKMPLSEKRRFSRKFGLFLLNEVETRKSTPHSDNVNCDIRKTWILTIVTPVQPFTSWWSTFTTVKTCSYDLWFSPSVINHSLRGSSVPCSWTGTPKPDCLGFTSRFWHWLAVATFDRLLNLCLSLLICKIGIIITPTSWAGTTRYN